MIALASAAESDAAYFGRPAPRALPTWPRSLLALTFAFFAGCPVLSNLIGTYVADGQSFAVTATCGCGMLLLAIIAAARIGLPTNAFSTMPWPLLIMTVIAVVFWCQWAAINVLSPSPQLAMHYQIFQAGIWILGPLTIFALYRDWIDPWQVLRFLVIIYVVFVFAMAARWALGLGFYQSGRWHAGKSLEAIRCGRYATMALWTCGLACLCPPAPMPLRYKAAALVCMPFALLMMVAANARGPWLAMAITVAITAIPLGRMLAVRIGRDARLLVALAFAVAGIGGFVASQIGGVDSDFNRLFTLTNDGGSAAGRVTLVQDHLQLLADSPLAIFSGCGYGHGYFYPHNVLVESLVNGGILSCGLLVAMILGTFATWLLLGRSDDVPLLMCFGLFILSLIGSEVSGSIGTDLTWYFPLLLNLAIMRNQPAPVAAAPPLSSAPVALAAI